MAVIIRLRDWLGQPQGPLTQTDADASRQGTDAPTTPGAMRLMPALDGELIWSHFVPDAAPLRAVEDEALVWSTMTIPPHARPWPPLANTNLAPLSRVESRKKDVLGWITVIVVLFSVALAALLGSAWLAV
jgi:hypothetical protein